MSFIIRSYTSIDEEAVLALLRANTPTYFAPSEESDFRHYLEHEREDYFVVVMGGEIVGAGGINYFYAEKNARISWDMLAPHQQGKGIGSQLIHHRLQHIQDQKNFERVIVRTSQHAYRFYEKAGFELLSVEKDYWAPGFDLYFMEKSIL